MASLATAPHPSFLSEVKRKISCSLMANNNLSLGTFPQKLTTSLIPKSFVNCNAFENMDPEPYISSIKLYPFSFNLAAIIIANSGCFQPTNLLHHIIVKVSKLQDCNLQERSSSSIFVKYPHLKHL